MTIHEILHLLADAVHISDEVRGDLHTSIDQHAADTAVDVPVTAAAAPADRAAQIADLEQQLADLHAADTGKAINDATPEDAQQQ